MVKEEIIQEEIIQEEGLKEDTGTEPYAVEGAEGALNEVEDAKEEALFTIATLALKLEKKQQPITSADLRAIYESFELAEVWDEAVYFEEEDASLDDAGDEDEPTEFSEDSTDDE